MRHNRAPFPSEEGHPIRKSTVRVFLAATLACAFIVAALRARQGALTPAQHETHRLYVAVPGIRSDLQYGGVGILVYDMDAGYKLIKRIPTWDVPPGQPAENVKGIAASAKTGKLYVSTIKRVACLQILGTPSRSGTSHY